MSAWKPGDVAMVRVSSDYPPEVAVSSGRQWFVAGPRLGSQHGWYHDRVEVVRPLVVIDPEDAEQVERLVERMARAKVWAVIPESIEALHAYRAEQMQAALREFADPKPRIEEPSGLGAVVEDTGGGIYVRSDLDTTNPWRHAGTSIPHEWSEIPVVRVLSEGWSE